jgi:hypothetical protein
MAGLKTYSRVSTNEVDAVQALLPTTVLNGVGSLLLSDTPEGVESTRRRSRRTSRLSRTSALDDGLGGGTDEPLEEVGAKASGADYDPITFSALRRRQILAHHRNGSISDRNTVSVWAVTWNVAGLVPTAAAVLDALGTPAEDAFPDLVVFGLQEAVDLTAREVLLVDTSVTAQWRGAALRPWPRG